VTAAAVPERLPSLFTSATGLVAAFDQRMRADSLPPPNGCPGTDRELRAAAFCFGAQKRSACSAITPRFRRCSVSTTTRYTMPSEVRWLRLAPGDRSGTR
jgi:hypothetical protein